MRFPMSIDAKRNKNDFFGDNLEQWGELNQGKYSI